uniref:Uncharacterized protein n=1 Tax=Arundo donax TaxID=35708 RepID=A0A0A9F8C0_ARUDO
MSRSSKEHKQCAAAAELPIDCHGDVTAREQQRSESLLLS